MYVPRTARKEVAELLEIFPAVGVLGPRQIGKTSLVNRLLREYEPDNAIYLDLERPADLSKLDDADVFLASTADKLVVIDEVQRVDGLFPVLRGAIDRQRRPGRFVLLGSASPTMLRTSGESLAGRVAYVKLSGLSRREVSDFADLESHWLRGGFPDSLLAPSDRASLLWRTNFIATYVERELPTLGLRADPSLMRRMWRMLGHLSGQLLNEQSLARALDLDVRTVKRYLDFFEEAYLVRRLSPYAANTKKRLVKSPKIYLRDVGLLHALLGVRDFVDLSGRVERGASWETLCVEEIATHLEMGEELSFYRTSHGAEVDVVIERHGAPGIAIEIKASSAPKPSRGFYGACDDLGIEHRYALGLVEEAYPLAHGVRAIGLRDVSDVLRAYRREE